MPARQGLEMELDGQRIRRPAPALRESRHEPAVADSVERIVQVSEMIVDQLGDLTRGDRCKKRREQNVGISTGRDDDRAAGSRCARLGLRMISLLAARCDE